MKWFRRGQDSGSATRAGTARRPASTSTPSQLLDEMSDDLLYHGDLNAALRRMMQQGFHDRNNEQLMGLREMLQKLRERRREELENRDLGGVYDDIAEQLDEVVDMEREGIDRRVDEATRVGRPAPPGARRGRRRAAPHGARAAPARPRGQGAGACRTTSSWTTRRAQRFEELMDQLREQLMQSYFNQLSEGMQNMTPERMAADEGHARTSSTRCSSSASAARSPTSTGFMERHGEFFPGNPQSLDELLEQMAQSMAQMQQLLNSMTPEQRAQLHGARRSRCSRTWTCAGRSTSCRATCSRRSRTCRGSVRSASAATTRCSSARCRGLLDTLGDLDDLENLLRSATQPGELAEVDLDRARELLGDDAAQSLDRLRELTKMLEEAGLIEQREGRLELTPRADPRHRQQGAAPTSTASC